LGWGWDYCEGKQNTSLFINIIAPVIAFRFTLAFISLASMAIQVPDSG
jgi:hypothetical protein